MKIFLLFLVSITIAFSANRLKWIDATPKGYKNDYFVGSVASAKSESDAREKASGNAIAAVVHNANTTAQVNQTLQRQQNEAVKSGQSVSYDDITSIASEVMQSILRIVKGESQKIVGLKEEGNCSA